MSAQDDRLADIFAPADATIAALNELHAAGRARRADMLDQLRQIVARLDDRTLPDEEDRPVEPPARVDERRRQQEPDEPFVILPQRSQPARGGPYGPKVEAKLRAIALEKGGW